MELITPSVVALWGVLGTTMSTLGMVLADQPTAPHHAEGSMSESTLVPLGMLMAGIAVTAALVWKVANQKHIVELNMKDLENRIDRLEEELSKVEGELKQDR